MTINRIGVCSWSLAPADLAELRAALGRVEIDCCQLALGPLLDAPHAWPDAVENLRGDGIEVVSGMFAAIGEDYSTHATIKRTGGLRPDATWEANLSRAEATARVAADTGVPLVTLHAGFIPHEPADTVRRVMLDRLRRVCDLFDDRGVRVAFETGQETAATLDDALVALKRPEVGVNFDPANMLLYGMGDPVEAVRRLGPRVRQVHVKDALPSPAPGQWGRETPVGAGAVDWPSFLAEVRALPRAVDLIIEREAGATREADIVRARHVVAAG